MADQQHGRRVVVTGMGVVTPIGTTVDEFWAGLRAGKSGVSALGGFPLEDLKILIAAQIKDFDHKARLKHFKRDRIISLADRYSWFAAVAADEAVRMSGLEMPIADPAVGALYSTNGRWDLVAELRSDSLEAFDRVLGRIRLIEGIASTETSLLLSTHKL